MEQEVYHAGRRNFPADTHVTREDHGHQSPPLENVQTTLVPAAGSSIAEFVVEVPCTYISVDHSIFRIEKGALGLLKVEGKKNPDVYKGLR